MDIPIEAITELNEGTSINIFSGTWQDNASGNVQNQTFNPIDKIVELYERLLKAEQEKVAILHEIVNIVEIIIKRLPVYAALLNQLCYGYLAYRHGYEHLREGIGDQFFSVIFHRPPV